LYQQTVYHNVNLNIQATTDINARYSFIHTLYTDAVLMTIFQEDLGWPVTLLI